MITRQQPTTARPVWPLFRATYLSREGRVRGMTFAAPTAFDAARMAEDWTLDGEKLLTVLPVARKHTGPEATPTQGLLAF